MQLDRSRCDLDGNSSLRWLFDLDIFLYCHDFLLYNILCDIPESFLSGKKAMHYGVHTLIKREIAHRHK